MSGEHFSRYSERLNISEHREKRRKLHAQQSNSLPPKYRGVNTAPIIDIYSKSNLSVKSPRRSESHSQNRLDLNEVQLSINLLQLDPVDRIVLRVADERDAMQKRTFENWINCHLMKINKRVYDIFNDLRDGILLLNLLEVLSDQKLFTQNAISRFHCLENINTVLDFLRSQNIKLVNIHAEDLVDGNPKLTLGLVWIIILFFQFKDIVQSSKSDDLSIKQILLQWSRKALEDYPDINIENFSTSWKDGKAFLALIHKKRPDLIDLKSISKNSAQQNLEMAFNTAQKELGVPKIIEPEDVMSGIIDEKSMMTYVASLFELNPKEEDIEEKICQFRNQYADLYANLNSALEELNDDFDHNDFRIDFNQTRLENNYLTYLKQYESFCHLFDDISKVDRNNENQRKFHTISTLWSKFETNSKEKSLILTNESKKVQRSEKISVSLDIECATLTNKVEEIESKIRKISYPMLKTPTKEMNEYLASISKELCDCENQINNMIISVQELKRDGYPADQHYRTIININGKIDKVKKKFEKLSPPTLSSGVISNRQYTPIHSMELGDNVLYSSLNKWKNWIDEKCAIISEINFTNDLDGLNKIYEKFSTTYNEIKDSVDEFKMILESENKYQMDMDFHQSKNDLKTKFNELWMNCSKIDADFKSFLEFLHKSNESIAWIKTKEDQQIHWQWFDTESIKLSEKQEKFKNLIDELEMRETSINETIAVGTTLTINNHSAANYIQKSLATLKSEWQWILNLTHCLKTHLECLAIYEQFFYEANEADNAILELTNQLNSRFFRPLGVGLDEGEILNREIRDMLETIEDYKETVNRIIAISQSVSALSLRTTSILPEKRVNVKAICSSKENPDFYTRQFIEGELLQLTNNSGHDMWRVCNSRNESFNAPAICFLITDISPQASQTAITLDSHFTFLKDLWTKRELQLREQVLLSTMDLVKNWTPEDFCNLEPVHRQKIVEILNQDANRLILDLKCANIDENEINKFHFALNQCNARFAELAHSSVFSVQMRTVSNQSSSPVKAVNRESFTSVDLQLDDLISVFTKMLQELSIKLASPVVLDVDLLEDQVCKHKEFETNLKNYEPQVNDLILFVKNGMSETVGLKVKLERMIDLWEQLWNEAHMFVIKLKSTEVFFSQLDEIDQVICEMELTLINQNESFPAGIDQIKILIAQLEAAQDTISSVVGNLKDVPTNLDQLISAVTTSRQNQKDVSYEDIQKLKKELKSVEYRYELLKNQIKKRLSHVNECSSQYLGLKNELKAIQAWIIGLQTTVKSQINVPNNVFESKNIESLMKKINNFQLEINKYKPEIDEINKSATYFLNLLQKYEDIFKNYQNEIQNQIGGSNQDYFGYTKRSRIQNAHDWVSCEIKKLNNDFNNLSDLLSEKLTECQKNLSDQATPPFPKSSKKSERIHTFRTENVEINRFRELSEIEETSETFFDKSPKLSYQEDSIEIISNLNRCQLSNLWYFSNLLSETISPISVGDCFRCRIIKLNSNSPNASDEVQSSTLEESLKDGIIMRKTYNILTELRNFNKCEKLSIIDMLKLNVFNIFNGTFNVDCFFEPLTISKAVNSQIIDRKVGGYLNCLMISSIELLHSPPTVISAIYSPKELKIQPPLLSLSDSVDLNLFNPISDKQIKFLDPITNTELKYTDAIRYQYINDDISEILFVDPSENSFHLTTKEAVKNKFFDPESGNIFDHNRDSYIPLHYARQEGILSKPISILQIVLEKDEFPFLVDINNEKSSISEALVRGIIDGNSEFSIKPNFSQKISLFEAVQNGLVTENGKIIVDKNKPSLSFLDAFNKGYIKLNESLISGPNQEIIHPNLTQKLTLLGAIQLGIIDTKNEKFINTITNEQFSLKEAYENKFISKSLLKDLTVYCGITNGNNEKLTILQAINENLIDIKTGQIFDRSNNQFISINEGYYDKIITENQYNRIVFLTCPLIKFSISIDEIAINIDQTECNLFENRKLYQTITTVYDSKQNEYISLDEARKRDFINDDMGMYYHEKDRIYYSFTDAIDANFIQTNNEKSKERVIEIKTIKSEKIKSYSISSVFNPITKEWVSARQAVEDGIIDHLSGNYKIINDFGFVIDIPINEAILSGYIEAIDEDVKSLNNELKIIGFKDPISGGIISPIDAIEKGLVDRKFENFWNTKSNQILTMNEAEDLGFVLTEKLEIKLPTINDLITQGLVDFDSGIVTLPNREVSMTLNEAINSNSIDIDRSMLKHPDNGRHICLREAIENDLFDPIRCEIRDNCGHIITLNDAINEDLFPEFVPTDKNKITFEEALEQGYIDLKTNTFRDPRNDNVYGVEEALAKNILDHPQSNVTVYMTDVQNSVQNKTLEIPNEEKFVDTKTTKTLESIKRNYFGDDQDSKLIQTVKDASIRQELPLSVATDERITAVNRKPSNSMENAHSLGLKSPKLSTNESLTSNITSLTGSNTENNSTQLFIINPNTGRKLNLEEAIKENIYDPVENMIRSVTNNNSYSWEESVKMGLIVNEGDSERVEEKIIQRNCVVYNYYYVHKGVGVTAKLTNQMLTENQIDPINQLIKDPKTGKSTTLINGLENGSVFATIITLTNRSLYFENLNKRHDNYQIISVYDPRINQLITYQEAIDRQVINIIDSTYINHKTNEISTLSDALQHGLLHTIMKTRQYMPLSCPFTNVHIRTIEEEMNFSIPQSLPENVLRVFSQKPNDNKNVEGLIITSTSVNLDHEIQIKTDNNKNQVDINQQNLSNVTDDVDDLLNIISDKYKLLNKQKMKESENILSSFLYSYIPIQDTSAEILFANEAPNIIIEQTEKSERKINLIKAMKEKLINPEKMTIKMAKTGIIKCLYEALEENLIDEEQTLFREIRSGNIVSLQMLLGNNIPFRDIIMFTHDYLKKDNKSKQNKNQEEIMKNKRQININKKVEKQLETSYNKNRLKYEERKRKRKSQSDMDNRGQNISALLTSEKERIDKEKQTEFEKISMEYSTDAHHLTLDEAMEKGLVDTLRGTIRDPISGKEISLQEAIARGIIDAENSAIYDAEKGQSVSLSEMLKSGKNISALLTSEKERIDKEKQTELEKISREYSNDAHHLTLDEAMEKGLVDTLRGTIRDPISGKEISLQEAIARGIIDAENSAIYDAEKGQSVSLSEMLKNFSDVPSLFKAYDFKIDDNNFHFSNNLNTFTHIKSNLHHLSHFEEESPNIIEADAPNFAKNYIEMVKSEMEKLSVIEQKLLKEVNVFLNEKENQMLLDEFQDVNNEFVSQQTLVLTLIHEIEKFLMKKYDTIPLEIEKDLEETTNLLKTHTNQTHKELNNRSRLLIAIIDEFDQFINRLNDCTSAHDKLKLSIDKISNVKSVEDLQKSLTDLKLLDNEFASYNNDIRVLIGSKIKFIDKINKLEEQRKKFSDLVKVPLVSNQDSKTDQEITELLNEVTDGQKDLQDLYKTKLSQIKDVLENLENLAEKQKKIDKICENSREELQKILSNKEELSIHSLLPHTDNLHRLNGEMVSTSKIIKEIEDSLQNSIKSLEAIGNTRENIDLFRKPIDGSLNEFYGINKRLHEILQQINEQEISNDDTVYSINNLDLWLKEIDQRIKNIGSLSLDPKYINEQERLIQTILAEISSRQPFLENVLMNNASRNEPKLKELDDKIKQKLLVASNIEAKVNDTRKLLGSFEVAVKSCGDWIALTTELLSDRMFVRLDNEKFKEKLDEIKEGYEMKQRDMEQARKICKELVSQSNCKDQNSIEICMENLEKVWSSLNELINTRSKELSDRKNYSEKYAQLKAKIIENLNNWEQTLSMNSPLAIDLLALENQHEDIEYFINEWNSSKPVINEFYKIGSEYDSIMQGFPLGGDQQAKLTSPQRKPSKIKAELYTQPLSPTSITKQPTTANRQSGHYSGSESSGVSSADYVNLNQEFSETILEINDIKSRYSEIGDQLVNRKSDIAALLNKCLSFDQEYKEFSDKLDSELNELLSVEVKNLILNDEIIEIERIDEDIRNLRPTLTNILTMGQDLLRNRELVPGGVELKSKLDRLEKKFISLKDSAKKHLNLRRNTDSQMKKFGEMKKSIENNIVRKERMLNVLGPVGTSVSYGNAQLQQVNALIDEVEGLENDVKELRNIGQEIIRSMSPTSSEVDEIEETLDRLSKKVDNLNKLLKDRELNIHSIMGPSKDFYKLINDVSDRLAVLQEKIDKNDTNVLTSFDWEEIQTELDSIKSILKESENLSKTLLESISDENTHYEIKNKVSNLSRNCREIQWKIDHSVDMIGKRSHHEDVLLTKLEDTEQWLQRKQEQLNLLSLEVGEIPTTLSDNIRQIQILQGDIKHKKSQVEDIYTELNRMNEEKSPTHKSKQIFDKLAVLTNVIENIDTDINNLSIVYQQASTDLNKINNETNKIEAWIDIEKHKMNKHYPVGLESIDSEIKLLECTGKSIENKHQQINDLKNLISPLDVLDSKTLLSKKLSSVFKVESDLKDLKLEADEKLEFLKKLQEQISTTTENMNYLKSALLKLETKAEEYLKFEESADKQPIDVSKLESEIKTTQSDMHLIKPDMENTKLLIASIAQISPVNATLLEPEMEKIVNRYQVLSSSLAQKLIYLNSKHKAMDECKSRIEIFATRQKNLREKIDNFPQSSLDLDSLEDQIHDLANLRRESNEIEKSLSNLKSEVENLAEQKIETAEKSMHKIDNLAAINEKIIESIDDRQNSLILQHKIVTEFESKKNDFIRKIDEANNDPELAKLLNNTSKNIGAFSEQKVDPLKKQLEELIDIGNKACSTVISGLGFKHMEQEMDSVKHSFDRLMQIVSDIENHVDIKLMKEQKFDTSLENLKEFVENISRDLDAEEEPSIEYHKSKSQLNSHRLLLDRLKKRQSSLDELNKAGSDLLINTKEPKKSQLQNELDELNAKYENLLNLAEGKNCRYDRAVKLSKSFKDFYEPSLIWLDTAEKNLANFDTSPTVDAIEMEKRIQEYKHLQNDDSSIDESIKKLKIIINKVDGVFSENVSIDTKNKINKLFDRFSEYQKSHYEKLELLLKFGNLLRNYLDQVNLFEDTLYGFESAMKDLKLNIVDPYQTRDIWEESLNLVKEVKSHEETLKNLDQVGEDLKQISSENDSAAINCKINILHNYFDEISVSALKKLSLFENSIPIAERFLLANNKLDLVLPSLTALVRENDSLTGQVGERNMEILENETNSVEKLVCQARNDLDKLKSVDAFENSLEKVEDIFVENEKRFKEVLNEVTKKATKIGSNRTKAKIQEENLDQCMEVLSNFEQKINEMSDQINNDYSELEECKIDFTNLLSAWNEQKESINSTINDSKKLIRQAPGSDLKSLKSAVDRVKKQSESTTKALESQQQQLDEAIPLAKEFISSYNTLKDWLVETEENMYQNKINNLDPDQLHKAEQEIKALANSWEDQKPLLDIIIKSGHPLSQIVNRVQGKNILANIEDAKKRYNNIKEFIKTRATDLEDLILINTELNEKVDQCANQLENIRDRITDSYQPSVYPEKLDEEIGVFDEILYDLDKLQIFVDKLQLGIENCSPSRKNANDKDDSVEILEKLAKISSSNKGLQSQTMEYKEKIMNLLSLANEFWNDLKLIEDKFHEMTIHLTNSTIEDLNTRSVNDKKKLIEDLRGEIDVHEKDIGKISQKGKQLIEKVNNPNETPDVEQAEEELKRNFEAVRSSCEQQITNIDRQQSLITKLEEMRMKLDEWFKEVNNRLFILGPLPTETRPVLTQIQKTKELKNDIEPKHRDIELINQLGYQLTKGSHPNIKNQVNSTLARINDSWARLLDGLGQRQHQLQCILLSLGEFHRAVDEFIEWIIATENSLTNIKIEHGDINSLEMGLAQHKMIRADMNISQASVSKMERKAAEIIKEDVSSLGHEATQRLEQLRKSWEELKEHARAKHFELEDALKEALIFYGDQQEISKNIDELGSKLEMFKFSGGLPDTAKEQLKRFMDIYRTFPKLNIKIEKFIEESAEISKKSSQSIGKAIEIDMEILVKKWDTVKNLAETRKSRLEKAIETVETFHLDMGKFINWLTLTEKNLNQQRPVSRIVSTILEQVEAHRALKRDITSHREEMLNLDKMATHLKYISQKHDIVLIRNLMSSIHHRWEKVVSRSSERSRNLDYGYKEAKRFEDMNRTLLDDIASNLEILERDTSIGQTPSKIREQITKHKEFHCNLGVHNLTYDSTRRLGYQLRDKAPIQDSKKIDEIVHNLQMKWQSLCNKSIEREKALNDALLLSGNYKDAMTNLLSWLRAIEPKLSDSSKRCGGDMNTVQTLLNEHSILEKQLRDRDHMIEKINTDAMALMIQSEEDSSFIEDQLAELKSTWNNVNKLANEKKRRLEEAKNQAIEFERLWNSLKEFFSKSEHELRQFTISPEEEKEELISNMISNHGIFHKNLLMNEMKINDFQQFGHEILVSAYPEAEGSIKHYINIIKSQWSDLLSWSEQRGLNLKDHLDRLNERKILLDDLLLWLAAAEGTLLASESRELSYALAEAKFQYNEHERFITDMTLKQKDHDEIITNSKKKTPPLIPIFDRSKRMETNQGISKIQEPLFVNPKINQLHSKWKQVWFMILNRRKRLLDHIEYLKEVENMKNFNFEDWRRRYMSWMNHSKSRVMDFFRRQDTDHDGRVTRKEFIDGIIDSKVCRHIFSKFQTTRVEMEVVADIFDKEKSGFIDYRQFLAALRPDRETYQVKPANENEIIHDEVKKQISKCTCSNPYKITQCGDGKYKFGDTEKLRLVRILRSNVMVRIGGGWCALDEFLVKHDPCRGRKHVDSCPIKSHRKSSLYTVDNLKGEQTTSFARNYQTPKAPLIPWLPSSSNQLPYRSRRKSLPQQKFQVPEYPSLSQVPEYTSLSQVPEYPSLSQVQGYRKISQVPEFPSLLQVPELRKLLPVQGFSANQEFQPDKPANKAVKHLPGISPET